jgi:hypothetical protein
VKLSIHALRLIAIAAMLAAVVMAVPRFLTHAPYPRLGVRLEFAGPMGFARVADVVGPPGKGVLQKGDLLVEFEGHALTQDFVIERFRKGQGWPREALEIVIERRGQRRWVTIPPLQLSAWERVRAVTLPLVGIVASPLVAFLLVWRRPDLRTAWVFLWMVILTALATTWNLFRHPLVELGPGIKGFFSIYHTLILFYPASFLHFMTVFPYPRWTPQQRTRSVWFWMVVLAYVTPVVLLVASRVLARSVDPSYLIFERIAVPLGCLLLIERYARPARPGWQPMTRERVIAITIALTSLAATALDAYANDARMMALFSIPLFRVAYTILVFALLGSPLLIAYLIANDAAFDPRRLIVRSMPYALLSGVLAAIYLGVVLVAERMFAASTGEEAMVFMVVAALVVAFAFAPIRERLQRWLDRLYGRDLRGLRHAVDQASHELLSALDRDEVRGAVESAVRQLKRPVRIEWPEAGMPRLAEPEDLRDEERAALESLLVQAGVRLENLSLQEARASAERRAAELREAATRAELRALHAQVQPHFVFNALNALSYLTETDPAAAQRFTERLADMLRYTVAAGERPAALLSEEIGFVEDYLAVARERYENPLCFEYHGAQDLLSVAVPPLLLQPLVENSLKHGCRPGTTALHLNLEASRENGWLTIVFRDDGAPYRNGGPGLGVGLQNLEQRVRRFGGHDASMRTERAADGGFAVELKWRVNDKEGE